MGLTKTIFITGATDGIGLETAKSFATKGHHLVIHGRDNAKVNKTKTQLTDINKDINIDCFVADLSDMQQVKQLAKQVIDQHDQIDVLINNAGVYKTPTPRTIDGLDVRFVVNTLAPYYLTKLLQPRFNVDSRVINLSSAAQAPVDKHAFFGHIQLPDMQAYAQSKRGIRLWSKGLALKSKTPLMISVNPGSLLASKMVKEGFGVAGSDLGIGVAILEKLALDREMTAHHGDYFDNDSGHFSDDIPAQEEIEKANEMIQTLEQMLTEMKLL